MKIVRKRNQRMKGMNEWIKGKEKETMNELKAR